MDSWMDGWLDDWMDGWTDGQRDRQTDRLDAANTPFFQFCEHTKKLIRKPTHNIYEAPQHKIHQRHVPHPSATSPQYSTNQYNVTVH